MFRKRGFRENQPKYYNERGVALVLVLAFVVLLTIAVVAFLARATAGRQLSNSSFHQAKVDELARSALDIVTSDIKQEIVNGSTVQTFGDQKAYLPTSTTNTVPARNPAPAVPNLMPTLLRISTDTSIPAPGVDHPASGALSSDPAVGGRSISLARWNKHYLIPRDSAATKDSDTTPISAFTAPKWVYVTEQGPEVLTTPKTTVIGRYAYAVYDEGALLDANVAGYPMNPTGVMPASSPHPAPDPYNLKRFGYGGKGATSFADLTAIGLSKNATTDLVGWRNYASSQPTGSFSSFSFDAASAARYFDSVVTNTNGFRKAGNATWTPPAPADSGPRTDQALVSRQQLLDLQKALGFSVDALQYLGTFSRAVTTPIWGPSTPAGSTIDYAGFADLSNAINRNFANMRHTSSATTTHYKDDGTAETPLSVRPGDPLLPRRFSLAKLAWLGHDGPNTTAFPLLTAPAIKACFGLTWHPSTGGVSSNARWDYDHGDPNNIKTLEEVRQAGREPDFFELLKAGILHGSLGGQPGAVAEDIGFTRSYPPVTSAEKQQYWEGPIGRDYEFYSAREDQHVLQIGANIIDQADSDNYPTAIYLNNSAKSGYSPTHSAFSNTVFGIENIPMLQRVGLLNRMSSPESAPPPGPMSIWMQPEAWNPNDKSTAATMLGQPNYDVKTAGTPNDPNYPTPAALRLVTYGKCYVWNVNEDPSQAGLSTPIDFGDDFSNPSVEGTICFKNPTPNSVNPTNLFDAPVFIKGLENASATRQYYDATCPSGAKNRYPQGATWTGSTLPFLAVFLGEVFRDPAITPYNLRAVPDDFLTFILEYYDGSSWRPYSMLNRLETLHDNGGGSGSRYGIGGVLSSNGHIDPRTDRFSGSAGRNAGGNPGWGGGATVRSTAATTVALSVAVGRSPIFQGWPRPSAGFVNPVIDTYLFDDWAMNLDVAVTGGNTLSAYRYKDPDGVVRPGDSWRADYPSGEGVTTYLTSELPTSALRRRPVILNRPFRSVGELGFVYRDLPFKTLDFWSDKSADSGLLDLFSVRDEPLVTAGLINPNNASAPVLQAIIAGTLQSESLGVTIPFSGTNSDTLNLATQIAAQLSTTALVSRGDLTALGSAIQTGFSNSSAAAATKIANKSNKTYAEAPLRALSSVSNTRTWNLMIDVIAQSGLFPSSAPQTAAALGSSFIVQGERRYWLHIAIDRYTGQVVDQQLECVYE